MTAGEAAAHVRSWLEQPVVRVPESAPDHIERVLDCLTGLGIAGNLVTDAQIAAVALDTMPLFTRPTRISSVWGPAMASTHSPAPDRHPHADIAEPPHQHALPCASLG